MITAQWNQFDMISHLLLSFVINSAIRHPDGACMQKINLNPWPWVGSANMWNYFWFDLIDLQISVFIIIIFKQFLCSELQDRIQLLFAKRVLCAGKTKTEHLKKFLSNEKTSNSCDWTGTHGQLVRTHALQFGESRFDPPPLLPWPTLSKQSATMTHLSNQSATMTHFCLTNQLPWPTLSNQSAVITNFL